MIEAPTAGNLVWRLWSDLQYHGLRCGSKDVGFVCFFPELGLQIPGKPVECDYRLVSMDYGLLQGPFILRYLASQDGLRRAAGSGSRC